MKTYRETNPLEDLQKYAQGPQGFFQRFLASGVADRWMWGKSVGVLVIIAFLVQLKARFSLRALEKFFIQIDERFQLSQNLDIDFLSVFSQISQQATGASSLILNVVFSFVGLFFLSIFSYLGLKLFAKDSTISFSRLVHLGVLSSWTKLLTLIPVIGSLAYLFVFWWYYSVGISEDLKITPKRALWAASFVHLCCFLFFLVVFAVVVFLVMSTIAKSGLNL